MCLFYGFYDNITRKSTSPLTVFDVRMARQLFSGSLSKFKSLEKDQ